MKQRKLIRADVLRRMHDEVLLGVPVARSMVNHLPPAEITRPTVVMLLDVFGKASDVELASLFPEWLDVTGPAVQEQPYSYRYVGRFPNGRWECEI